MRTLREAPSPQREESQQRSVIVVVPAASEATIIGRLIATLAAQDHRGPTSIAIAVNGASDGTARIARTALATVPCDPLRHWQVIEIEERSKPRALNAGERAARTRLAELGIADPEMVLYLDADIELSTNAVRSMADHLSGSTARIVQPRRCAESGGGSLGRLAGGALCALPWVADDVACGGLFAVNRAGRSRWNEFPDLGADDAYVFRRFHAQERVVVGSAWATHPMPSTWRGLARQQRRWREARRELERSGTSSAKGIDSSPKWPLRRRLRSIICSPRILVSLVFLRAIRLWSILDATPFTSHAWNVDREQHLRRFEARNGGDAHVRG